MGGRGCPHLDARVDLQEVVAAVLVHHELHCTRVHVPDVPARRGALACSGTLATCAPGFTVLWLTRELTPLESLRFEGLVTLSIACTVPD